jgi:hypothetical protein
MRTFDLASCAICGGTGWGSQYSTPQTIAGDSVLVAVYAPCREHGPRLVPDRIKIPVRENRGPELGRDFVLVEDVCLAGEIAVNGRCGDLDCVCAPSVVPSGARVVRAPLDHGADESERFFVCEDHLDGTFTLMADVGYKLLLRIPKSGWSLIGTLPFPIEPEVVA